MFIGHYGIAFAARRASPRTSLGVLVLAAQWVDLVWPIFLLLGWERVRIAPGDTRLTPLDFASYPWTHSLVAVLVWALVVGGVAASRRGRRAGLVVGGCVASHWVLDFVTHRPDLQLVPGIETRAGLGLWNVPAVALALEALIFFGGLWLYVRSTTPRSAGGRWGLVAFVAFLVLAEVSNLLGPPPPSVTALAWVSLALWLLVPWAAAFDRRRALRD
jgi:LexA-binding, inner membrane-associated putative hydrolase